MRLAEWIICLWPGLPGLWRRGEWSALGAAVAFGVLLNAVLTASFIWPEIAAPAWVVGGWLLVGGVWCVSVGRSLVRLIRERRLAGADGGEALFIRAQTEYLRGHWFEAESLLRRLVDDGGDADALLMLASLYRRTNRWAEARRRLALLERLAGAEKWRWELHCERRLLDRNERLAATDGEGDCGSLRSESSEAGVEGDRPRGLEAA